MPVNKASIDWTKIKNKPSTLSGLGITDAIVDGQTWQNVTASRAVATTYYNTTNRPITVMVGVVNSSTQNAAIIPVVNGITLPTNGGNNGNAGATYGSATFIVPPAGSYSVTSISGAGTLNKWTELR